MRVLISGVSGFVGRHLARSLAAQGHTIFGLARAQPLAEPIPVLAAVHTADLRDLEALVRVLSEVQPEAVVHLAAQSSVSASFTEVDETYVVNVLGSVRMFAAVQRAAPRSRVILMGSADEYGVVDPGAIPVGEETPLRPVSPYGASKAAADLAAHQWVCSYGLDIVRVRAFSSTGTGQAARFVCADFASQIVAAERAGQRPVICGGALDIVRDFVDVRDLASAIGAVLLHGRRGEVYNICSGVGRTPRQIAETLLSLSGHSGSVETSPERQRPAEIPMLIGDASKLRQTTGWSPRISWEQTLSDVLADWRARGV